MAIERLHVVTIEGVTRVVVVGEGSNRVRLRRVTKIEINPDDTRVSICGFDADIAIDLRGDVAELLRENQRLADRVAELERRGP